MNNFEQFYSEAMTALKDGDFQEARNCLLKAEKSYEKTGALSEINKEDIYILGGTIEFAANELVEANEWFEKALQANPQSVEASIGMGKVLFAGKMYEEAKLMFECSVANSDDERAMESLHQINKILGYPEDDISLINKEETEDEAGSEQESQTESDLSVYFDKAYDLFLDDKYDETLEMIEKIEKQYQLEINIIKGNTYLALDRLDDAKKSFEEVLKINKKSSEACNGLAEMYFKSDMFEDAKTMYECALEINPDDQFALLGLAEINQKLGFAPTHTFPNFFNILDIPEEINNEIEKAYKYFSEQKYEKAVKIVEKLEAKSEEMKEAHRKEFLSSLLNLKGFNLLALNKKDEAKEVFEKSLDYNSDSSQACTGLGEILFMEGEENSAKTMLEWAIKNNNKNQLALTLLAKVNRALGYSPDHSLLSMQISEGFSKRLVEAYDIFKEHKYEKALEEVEKLEKEIHEYGLDEITMNTLSSVLNFKGFCFFSSDKIDEAKSAFEQSIKYNSKSSQACAGLGEVMYLEGNDKEAKEMFELAIKYNPHNKFAEAGLKKVSEVVL